ncbi:MAG: phosphatidylglycerophosphatase A [Xanthomonadales bacterium]|nr:phosphatidylglycerophosphatase A [Xanthomonadales bacterium]
MTERDPVRQALLDNVRRWDGFLALGFGSGLSPVAPGTAGTLVAVPLAWALKGLPFGAYLALLGVFLVMGAWLCGRVGSRIGVTDHGALVWDEFVGYWLAVALVPRHWGWLLAGFVLFRILDIFKPWPIRALERRVPGGWGVMLDDVLAGAMTLALLALGQALLPRLLA